MPFARAGLTAIIEELIRKIMLAATAAFFLTLSFFLIIDFLKLSLILALSSSLV